MLSSNQRSNQNVREALTNIRPGVAFIVMIFGALIAFEVFNYTTTDHALADLLGDLQFIGIPWSTILALAFCGIDFAGIARLFTPEQGMKNEPKEVWYLFGAWLLAATMNAILTWWGVSMAVVGHQLQSSTVVDPGVINSIVPVFVAVMVWVIRILIIGTLSLSMDRIMHPGAEQHQPVQDLFSTHNNAADQQAQKQSDHVRRIPNNVGGSQIPMRNPATVHNQPVSPRPATRYASPAADEENVNTGISEPTYHPLTGNRSSINNSGSNAGRYSGNGNGPYRRP